MRRLILFALGICFGAAIGSALAFLLTPASGQDLRKRAEKHVQRALSEARAAAEVTRKSLEAELEAAQKARRAVRK